MSMTPEALNTWLAPHALAALGHCAYDGQTLVLVGPDEPTFWPLYQTSPEARDGAPDPLDRWSHRVLGAIAADVNGTALFPFGGPPFQPFHTWALRTGRFWSSPIGFLVHDTAGLFVSFRGALLLPVAWPAQTSVQPCLTCADRPCASACPVDAFAHGYDVAACNAHIHRAAGQDCMTLGCRARRACPVGRGRRLPAQAAFHMEAFRWPCA